MAEKLYFKIGEACKQLDIQPYVLRYWETEFSALSPDKSKSGQRVYSRQDLGIIRRIKELLYDEGYTIAGAKKKLEGELESGSLGEPGEEAADEAAPPPATKPTTKPPVAIPKQPTSPPPPSTTLRPAAAKRPSFPSAPPRHERKKKRKGRQQTDERLVREAVRKTTEAGKKVLFLGTKPQAKNAVREEAVRCAMPYVTERWLGGTLTNFNTVRLSLGKLDYFEKIETDGTIEQFSKKEALKMMKHKEKLLRALGGIREMHDLPGMVFVIDTKKEMNAVREARKLRIPIIGLIDTNADLELCYERTLAALAPLPEIEARYLPPEIREDLEQQREHDKQG